MIGCFCVDSTGSVFFRLNVDDWPTMGALVATGFPISVSNCYYRLLPAWYVFTGCNYEPSFYGKGVKTCIKILDKSVEFQNVFGKVGAGLKLKDEDIVMLEKFKCELYGIKSTDINDARCIMFQKSYGHNMNFSKKGKCIGK